jgi:hypothetical protein
VKANSFHIAIWLLLGCVLVSCKPVGSPEKWVVYARPEKGALHSYDPKSVTYGLGALVTVREREVPADSLGILEFTYVTEIRCVERTSRILELYVEHRQENLTSSSRKPSSWVPIDPGSPTAVLAEGLCRIDERP